MICKNCGSEIPSGIPNCINCGTKIDPNSIDYQQLYYKQKVERNDNIKQGFSDFGNKINAGANNIQNSISDFGKSVSSGVNSAVDNVSSSVGNAVNDYKAKPEVYKKGSDAYIMGIVALVLSVVGFRLVALVLGILAIVWGGSAYKATNEHNHKLAKTFGIISVVVSSIAIVGTLIVLIVELVFEGIYYFNIFDNFELLMSQFFV